MKIVSLFIIKNLTQITTKKAGKFLYQLFSANFSKTINLQ